MSCPQRLAQPRVHVRPCEHCEFVPRDGCRQDRPMHTKPIDLQVCHALFLALSLSLFLLRLLQLALLRRSLPWTGSTLPRRMLPRGYLTHMLLWTSSWTCCQAHRAHRAGSSVGETILSTLSAAVATTTMTTRAWTILLLRLFCDPPPDPCPIVFSSRLVSTFCGCFAARKSIRSMVQRTGTMHVCRCVSFDFFLSMYLTARVSIASAKAVCFQVCKSRV